MPEVGGRRGLRLLGGAGPRETLERERAGSTWKVVVRGAEAPSTPPRSPLERREHAQDWIRRLLESAGKGPGDPQWALMETLLYAGEEAVRKADDPAARFTPRETVGAEFIIVADGTRPVFLIQNGALDAGLIAGAGAWAPLLSQQAEAIRKLGAAMGRIDLPGSVHGYQGTGFLVAPDLLMTNRHVLQAIADETDGVWTVQAGATVDFGREYGGQAGDRVAVREVVFAGRERVNVYAIDHAILDLVLLRLERAAQAAPLPISTRPEADDTGRRIAVCGFPADPGDTEPPGVPDRIFDFIFGYKVLAPGRVDVEPGGLGPADPRGWTFGHDATTLGGNSGSAIIDLRRGALASGLHYGGKPETMNYAHSLAKALAEPVPSGGDLRGLLAAQGAVFVDP